MLRRRTRSVASTSRAASWPVMPGMRRFSMETETGSGCSSRSWMAARTTQGGHHGTAPSQKQSGEVDVVIVASPPSAAPIPQDGESPPLVASPKYVGSHYTYAGELGFRLVRTCPCPPRIPPDHLRYVSQGNPLGL